MISRKADKLATCALALLVLYAGVPGAAEVKGTVSVDYQGLFRRGETVAPHPVSVALVPAAGQRARLRATGRRTIEIVGNRMQPAFLTVQQGDAIQFINRDDVYHELFTLSSGQPVNTRLGKAGNRADDRTTLDMKQGGTIHFFCRIHSKSYARIDVVKTPYIQMVKPGESFSFSGLQPGRWRLRLAAPAAETEWLEVAAVTSPPPLQLTLVSRGGGAGRSVLRRADSVDQLYGSLPDEGGVR
jgi:plastocyanin